MLFHYYVEDLTTHALHQEQPVEPTAAPPGLDLLPIELLDEGLSSFFSSGNFEMGLSCSIVGSRLSLTLEFFTQPPNS